MKLTKLILTAVAATIGLSAQGPGGRITAKVPFPFEVRGEKMPAGTYEVVRADGTTYLTMREMKTGRGTLVILGGEKGNAGADGNALGFRKYGEAYSLSEISYRGRKTAMLVPATRREKEMATRIAPETVIARAD